MNTVTTELSGGEVVAASPARFYRPELDVLRFFAFCMVFCSHNYFSHPWLAPLSHAGGFGVQIFFCLSAFLLVTILLREREQTGTVGIKAFALRRILRIWPLYLAVLSYGWWMTAVPHDPRVIFCLLLMAGNLYVVRHGWAALGVLLPLWSISVEEQFYLVIPLLARLGGRRVVWAACLVTLAASYGALVFFGRTHAVPNLNVWASSFVEFQFFAGGGVVALLLFGRTVRISPAARMLLAAAGICLLYWAAEKTGIRWIAPIRPVGLMQGYFAVLLGACLLLLSVMDMPLRPPGILVYLGKISYGLYVLHIPVYTAFVTQSWRWPWFHMYFTSHHAASIVIWFLATILISALSYRFFESPFLRLKQRLEVVTTRPV